VTIVSDALSCDNIMTTLEAALTIMLLSLRLLELSIMLLETFIVQASIVTIVIYDRHNFIVEVSLKIIIFL
jgi:hypothetical protein